MKVVCETLTRYSSHITETETRNLKLNDELNDPEINNTFPYM